MKTKKERQRKLTRDKTVVATAGTVWLGILGAIIWKCSYEDGRKDEQLLFQKAMAGILLDSDKDE